MTIQFTRVSLDENNDDYPDGEYKAELQKIDDKDGLYGRCITVEWLILEPEEYKGRIKWEHFNIGSDIPEYQKSAQLRFNKFWSQMTDDKDGDIDDLQKVCFKEVILKIKNYPSKKTGEMQPWIVYRSRTDKKDKQMGFFAPQTPTVSSELPNDEISF